MSHPGGIFLFQRFQHLSRILGGLDLVEVDDDPVFSGQRGCKNDADAYFISPISSRTQTRRGR